MSNQGPYPTPLRRIAVGDLPETDYAIGQTVPDEDVIVDVATCKEIRVSFVPRKADESLSTGTVDLQLVDIGVIMLNDESTDDRLIEGSTVDLAVAVGEGLTYDVRGSTRITVRVAGNALAGDTAFVDIYWRRVS